MPKPLDKAPPTPGMLPTKLVIPVPNPPAKAPKAEPTPGISIATGATFLATFLIDLKAFLKKPNSGRPVIGFIDMPAPTSYSFGSRPAAIIS